MSYLSNQINYVFSDLMPYLSELAVQIHFEKHHAMYAKKLNDMIKDSDFEDMSLDDIIIKSRNTNQSIFNNAGQLFNHNFYWASLKTNSALQKGALYDKIIEQFESIENFKNLYIEHANKMFGSGWSWVCVEKSSNALFFENTQNAESPIGNMNISPVCVIDLWEHSYYVDYRNDRLSYLNNVIQNCLNWDFCSNNFTKAIA